MNQRRDTSTPSPAVIGGVVGVVLIVLVGAIYWFVVRDDNKASGNGGDTSSQSKTFTAPGNSFTFSYPTNFQVKDEAEAGAAGYVWLAGVGPYDLLNVKRLDNKPTPAARLHSSIRKSLSNQPGTTIVGEGNDNRGGIAMVTFSVESTLEGKPLHSDFYYFTANKVTWQLECESQSQRAVIDSACAQALGSFAGVS